MYNHKPILQDTIKSFIPKASSGSAFSCEKTIKDKVIVDCTAGEGGHSLCLLESMRGGKLILIDRDSSILDIAKRRLKNITNCDSPKLVFKNGNFSVLRDFLLEDNINYVDFILYDLGISAYHYKEGRGFSFNDKKSLDMRLDYNNSCKKGNVSAHELINSFKESDIKNILLSFGEEHEAYKIARKIVQIRGSKKIETAEELSNIVISAKKQVHSKNKKSINPATKTFQALRMYVNKELYHIKRGLIDGIYSLGQNGAIATLTFHSLEDRLVKNIFQYFERSCVCHDYAPFCTCSGRATLKKLNRKVITPSKQELLSNPSARSAKLRIVEKLYEERVQTQKDRLYKTAKEIFHNENNLNYSPSH